MSKSKLLQDLYQNLESSVSSLPLVNSFQDIVPGEGSAQAEMMFIGEAPGFYEARDRRPFVGRSGQLLRKTLEEVGVKVADVYISNIVKVRPPDNRDPTLDEIQAFKQVLDKEIEIIKPLLVVTLGRYSMYKFLPDVRISQVHGRLHQVKWKGELLFVLPMYHPAAALRGTQIKNSFTQDLTKIPSVMSWIKKRKHDHRFLDEVKDSLL